MKRNWVEEKNVPDYLKDEINVMTDSEYADAFGSELEFGTAGLRGFLGAGTSRLNIFTIRKVTLGLANFLLEKYAGQEIKVIVGYDSRHFSVEFSENVAQIMASKGIETLIYDQVKPTPLLSYGVRHFGCQAGIMITASHNPKEYNGYKVYNETGCQVNIEEGNTIIEYVNKVNDIVNYECPDFSEVKVAGKVKYIDDAIDEIYFEDIKKIIINDEATKDIKVVFTPAHGTSGVIGPKMMKKFGYNNLIEVTEQMYPDGDFTNVKDANPENEACYDLAKEYAIKHDADIIVANDPDADRLGVMYKDRNNEYHLLSGNQTGALLLDYILTNKKVTGNEIVYNTVVTGELGSIIVKDNGAKLKQTLTGFKFIGEQIEKNKNDKFIFGYEESYGYLLHECVRDKDALQALLMVSEMTNFYLNKGINLGEKLDELYSKYGYYNENTYSISLSSKEGLEKIKKAMKYYRENEISEIANLEVESKLDYQTGVDDLPHADVLKFHLKGKGWFALRPSGTEPKLKIYISIKDETMEEAIELSNQIHKIILNKIDEF